MICLVSGCDNSRPYVPEVRQYYSLVLLCFQPRTDVPRTFCWYHMTFPSPRYSLPEFSWYIMCLTCFGMKFPEPASQASMKDDWTDGTKKRWSRLFVYAIVLLFLPRSLNVLFRNLCFMNLIVMTKYTFSIEFVQVPGNNHWRANQVRLKS